MRASILAVAVAGLLSSGCVNPELGDGWFTCSDEHPDCPEGQTCGGGRCVKGPLVDLGLDGPQLDLPDGPVADCAPHDQAADLPSPDQRPSDLQLTPDLQPVDLNPTIDTAKPVDLNPPPDTAKPVDLTPPPDTTKPVDLFPPPTDGGPGPLTVVQPSGIPFSVAATADGPPAVAWGAGVYLVVWDTPNNNGDVACAVVSSTGTIQSTLVLGGAASQVGSAVAFDGTNFLVVWTDEFSHIRGKRVSPAGTIVDNAPLEISQLAGNYVKQSPAVASTGSLSLVVWEDTRNNPTTGVDVYGALVKPDGSLLGTDIAISTASGAQEQVDVAALSSGFLVVWENQGVSTWRVEARPVSTSGAIGNQLDFPGQGTKTNRFPSVGAGNGQYLLVWIHDSSMVQAQRVSAAGAKLGTAPALVHGSSYATLKPDVAWNGAYHLVVWDGFTGSEHNIYGARVSGAGVLVDSPPMGISLSAGNQDWVAAAGGPGHWMVVWRDSRTMATTSYDVFGTLVN